MIQFALAKPVRVTEGDSTVSHSLTDLALLHSRHLNSVFYNA